MYKRSVYDLKAFYGSRSGRLMRRLLSRHIRAIWPDVKGLRLMGYGYAVPYLRGMMEGTERTFALMPPGSGVHYWPEGENGLVGLASEMELPIETESVDRILLVHGLEQSQAPQVLMQELWRVLKSNGRILMVVPNRLGLWARADWTPFGHGAPWTARQIVHCLEDNLFVHERTDSALYMPPFRSFYVMRTAYIFENIGRFAFPGFAGVHLVEASKQVYAGTGRARTARIPGRRILISNPLPAG